MADEAGEDGGQAVAGSVQHDSGGSSSNCCLGAAAPCRATGKKYTVSPFLRCFFILHGLIVLSSIVFDSCPCDR